MRTVLSELLWLRGHQVTAVPDAEEASEAHSLQPFPFLIVDAQLPGTDGLEFCRQLRAGAGGEDALIVMLTAKRTPDELERVLSAGANDYVTTPLDIGLLQVRLGIAERLVAEIERRKAAEEALQHQSFHDALTGLPNRTLLHDRLRQAILKAQRTYEPLALLVMDIDRFADINDTLGHHFGDVVLQHFGQRLLETMRTSDSVARLGGDEFAILAQAADDEGALRLAKRVLDAMEQPFVLDGINLDVEASIGIALYPFHGADANTLIQRADVAMYNAKQARSGYSFYTSDRDEHSSAKLALMGDLRRAIERDELVLFYQPKIRTRDGAVVGAEALVRWQHPVQGLLFPDRFVPLAEQSGLIRALTLWVINEALRQSKIWQDMGLNISVAVNLSARNLQDPSLPSEVYNALRTHAVDPKLLELEITESAVMDDPEYALNIVTQLAALGTSLSIDDFGTGYSSLAYLKRLPVHYIKVDKSFVMDMLTNDNDATIVRSIINLSHDLGLKTVAEGVETREIFERLAQLECDLAQGYYMSKPIPAAAFERWTTETWSTAQHV
jgi:diguanylate cyclase (GGDEF)-like protein